MSIVTEMYEEGYEDGKKVGKTETLNDLMNVVLGWKKVSSAVSCDYLMQLLKSRKDTIEQ